MTVRMQATGVNATPKWFWVYHRDTTSLVPRPRAVRVPWGMLVNEYRQICDGINAELARRMAAEADANQLRLPLEKWE